MIDVLPRELVIESALHAIVQLTGSTIPNNEFRIDQLKRAIDKLRDPGSRTYLVEGQQARSDIRQILYIIHTYRCERWEGLVHACNQLLGAAWLASWLLYVLLAVAILAQVPVNTMYQISVFLLLGAIIGLFGRLLNEVYPENAAIAHVDDYGLTIARILVTPLLSSLAVLVGVPLAVIALAMLQGGQSVVNLPTSLKQCYDFFIYPGNLLIAGIFAYLLSTVISLLKQQANRSQSELLSSSATK